MIIALIPKGANGEAHSTLCYMGEDDPTPTEVQSVCLLVRSLASYYRPFSVEVTQHAMFGVEMDEPAAMIQGGLLEELWGVVKDFSNSQWGYNPHIAYQKGYTPPPVGSVVWFDRIAVWNHDERYAWRLGTGATTAP